MRIAMSSSRRIVATATAALLSITALAACSATGDADDELTDATLQLGWIANIENMGPYVALDNGYYADAGVNLTIEPGGPAVTVEPLVVSGKVLVGLGSADAVARAIEAGAPLKIVAATLQSNPTSVMSLADAPITTLAELEGKRLCVQNSGVEISRTILESNDVDPDAVEFVTADFDPSPLVTGQCEAFLSFLNNQPVTLAAQGIETHNFLLADYGYNIPGNVFIVSEETLADDAKRDTVIKIIEATSKGWRAALDDTDSAAEIIATNYGKNQNLDLEQQQIGADAMTQVVETEDTRAHGLLTMTPESIAAVMTTLDMFGETITADELFDTSLLEHAELTK